MSLRREQAVDAGCCQVCLGLGRRHAGDALRDPAANDVHGQERRSGAFLASIQQQVSAMNVNLLFDIYCVQIRDIHRKLK